MDDIAHIALVDPHAERIRRHHDCRPVIGEIILRLPAFLVRHARMVAPCRDPRLREPVIHLIHRFSGRAVDDAALLPVRLHIAQDEILAILALHHAEGEIRPVKPRAENSRPGKPQAFLHILLDERRRRRGEGRHDGTLRQAVDEAFDLPIRWTEIMPPLRHTVRLIDHDHRERHHGETMREIRRLELLRRHVEQLDPSAIHVTQPLDRLLVGDRAVHIGGGDPLLRQRLHLILHEGDQRRNDDRPLREQHRRDLEADRLPRTCRHDGHHILPGKDGRDHILLYRAECVVAKIFLQHVFGSHSAPPFDSNIFILL